MSTAAQRAEETDGAAVEEPTADGPQPVVPKLEQRHETDHFRIASTGVLGALGVGVLFREPVLVLVAVVGVGLLAYRQFSAVPEPALAVDRSIGETEPEPDDVVAVETTVRNVGDATLPDCRFVDRLPAELPVVDGSPRIATALSPGDACTIRYTVRAERGAHEFEGVDAIVRDVAGTAEHEYWLRSRDELACSPTVKPLNTTLLRSMTTPYAGRLPTDRPGEGLEFHATREYRPGDSLRRIDWNQYASTGDLATLQFRTERAASVVVLVDVRDSSYVRADSDDDHAADRCVEAAGRLFVSLLDLDHRAGLATLGPDYWLPPGGGTDHRHRGIEAIGTEPALSPSASGGTHPVRLRLRWLRRRLPDTAQVVLCSPLLDWSSQTAVQVLESYGHSVTVVSPDPTGDGTTGARISHLERQNRIGGIHRLGVPVVDWSVDESLDVAVARTARGWSG